MLKTEEDRFRGIRGLPDLLCTSQHGLQLWLELKRPASSRNPRGRVRKAQRERLAAWRARGVPCAVVDGVSEELLALAALGRRPADAAAALELCDRLMEDYEWWERP